MAESKGILIASNVQASDHADARRAAYSRRKSQSKSRFQSACQVMASTMAKANPVAHALHALDAVNDPAAVAADLKKKVDSGAITYASASQMFSQAFPGGEALDIHWNAVEAEDVSASVLVGATANSELPHPGEPKPAKATDSAIRFKSVKEALDSL